MPNEADPVAALEKRSKDKSFKKVLKEARNDAKAAGNEQKYVSLPRRESLSIVKTKLVKKLSSYNICLKKPTSPIEVGFALS